MQDAEEEDSDEGNELGPDKRQLEKRIYEAHLSSIMGNAQASALCGRRQLSKCLQISTPVSFCSVFIVFIIITSVSIITLDEKVMLYPCLFTFL